MANETYYIPADGLFHWNEEFHTWERLNRTINYKGCVLRSVTYHRDWVNPKDCVNHKEWRITFPDGHEGHFGSVKRGGSLKELKEYIDFKEQYNEL
jgi:hypothetical protein